MNNDVIISVENLSKKYVLGKGGARSEGLRHAIHDLTNAPFRWLKKSPLRTDQGQGEVSKNLQLATEDFWALKDVSFEVKRGEVVGIIGRNGAGKSTLLKILSRITEPTEGRVTLRGRVASLLEVGTGFHPELTGRENVFLNGAILGMTRAEIRKKFDEIVAFAEVEKFLETPVKRYSSGMYVRLAFAVAAHLEPEILIVDEVLAVGDAQFQKKCLGKMQEVSKGGRTVLFVSHNMSAVLQLTTAAIVLYEGKLSYQGTTPKAVESYLKMAINDNVTIYEVENAPRKYKGSFDAKLLTLRFDRNYPSFFPSEDFAFIVKVRSCAHVNSLRFSMTIFSSDGTPIGTCFGDETPLAQNGGEHEMKVVLPHPSLAPGHYYCGVSIGKGSNKSSQVDFDTVLDILHFEIRLEEGELGTVANWGKGWGAIILPKLATHQLEPGRLAI